MMSMKFQEIWPNWERLPVMPEDWILSRRVLPIRLGREKEKNIRGREGGFSDLIWSGKDTMGRHAVAMERSIRNGFMACFQGISRPTISVSGGNINRWWYFPCSLD
jgi:hypothetical protein